MKKINRRDFLESVGAGAIALSFAGCNSIQTNTLNKPNVVFIAIDDFNPEHLGCYGGSVCKTPNVDAFAKNGVLFQNAYCSAPACVPSRTSLLRGLRPENSVIGNFSPNKTWSKNQDEPTIYSQFQKHGYEIVTSGKVSHGSPKSHVDIPLGSDKSMIQIMKAKSGAPFKKVDGKFVRNLEFESEVKRYKCGIVNFKGRKMPIKVTYGCHGIKEEHTTDYMSAERAIIYLDRKSKGKQSKKPFFLSLGFTAPHMAFSAPKKFHNMYPIKDMKVPFFPKDDLKDMIRDYANGGAYPPRDLPVEVTKEMISSHFACMSHSDKQIGRVIQKLKDIGEYENTVIVIWSDHGNMIGDHSMWLKGPLLEESVRSALLFKVPGITKSGTVCKRPVESVDIFATLTDVCGLSEAKGRDSVSMRTLLENPNAKWREGAIITSCDVHSDGTEGTARMLRTETYSLVKQYVKCEGSKAGAMELYDLTKDPKCFNNVAYQKEYKTILDGLVKILDNRYYNDK